MTEEEKIVQSNDYQNADPSDSAERETESVGRYAYFYKEEYLPMDILLDLCKKGKVDIKDIFVSDVIEQYIAFVQTMEEKDYDNISSFILMAAMLLELKSSELLPKVVFEDSDTEDILDPREMFLLHMEEYKLYKEAAEKLGTREILNRFYREPMFGENDYKLVIKNFDLSKMIKAFEHMMEKVEYEDEPNTEKTIVKERFTVADRVTQLIEIVRAYGSVKLYSLFEKDYTRLEIINTFLAMLEILKKQIARAEQLPDGNILITHAADTDRMDAAAEEEMLKDVDGYN